MAEEVASYERLGQKKLSLIDVIAQSVGFMGPVFSAGSITQERERQTLALLLTTLLRPGRIVLAKLLAALRVSTVLTFLLTEQLLLAETRGAEFRARSELYRALGGGWQ